MDAYSFGVESAGTPRHYQTNRAPQPNATEHTVDGRVAQLGQKQPAPKTSLEWSMFESRFLEELWRPICQRECELGLLMLMLNVKLIWHQTTRPSEPPPSFLHGTGLPARKEVWKKSERKDEQQQQQVPTASAMINFDLAFSIESILMSVWLEETFCSPRVIQNLARASC